MFNFKIKNQKSNQKLKIDKILKIYTQNTFASKVKKVESSVSSTGSTNVS